MPSLNIVQLFSAGGEQLGPLPGCSLASPTSVCSLATGGLAVLHREGISLFREDGTFLRTLRPGGLSSTMGLAQEEEEEEEEEDQEEEEGLFKADAVNEEEEEEEEESLFRADAVKEEEEEESLGGGGGGGGGVL